MPQSSDSRLALSSFMFYVADICVLYLFDDSMQYYKTALQIQKALCENSNVEVIKKELEVSKKKLDNSLPSDDFELNLAIADTLSGIGSIH